jgi:predicted RNA-binding Zn-ribbon protein involved in translation (DUF1610 family)
MTDPIRCLNCGLHLDSYEAWRDGLCPARGDRMHRIHMSRLVELPIAGTGTLVREEEESK